MTGGVESRPIAADPFGAECEAMASNLADYREGPLTRQPDPRYPAHLWGVNSHTPARRPAGSPAGGQFANTSHAETDLDLVASEEYEDAVFSGRETDEALDGLTDCAMWSSADIETGKT